MSLLIPARLVAAAAAATAVATPVAAASSSAPAASSSALAAAPAPAPKWHWLLGCVSEVVSSSGRTGEVESKEDADEDDDEDGDDGEDVSYELRVVALAAPRAGVSVDEITASLPSGIIVLGALADASAAAEAEAMLRDSSSLDGWVVLPPDSMQSASLTASDGPWCIQAVTEMSAVDDERLADLLVFRASYTESFLGSTAADFLARMDELRANVRMGSAFAWCVERGANAESNGRVILQESEEGNEESVGGLLADDNPLLLRRKAQKSAASASAAFKAVATIAPPALSIPDFAVELSLLLRSAPPSDEEADLACAPTLAYSKASGPLRTLQLKLDVLHHAASTDTLQQVLEQLQSALLTQLAAMHSLVERELAGIKDISVTAQALHFQPAQLGHALTSLFLHPTPPVVTPFNGDTKGAFPAPAEDQPHPALQLTLAEQGLTVKRKRLHECWGLSSNCPAFRFANALSFPSSPSPFSPAQFILQPRLLNPHLSLLRSTTGGTLHVVKGDYAYYHYMQDKLNDSGWGCAYRTLQSICSAYILAGYVSRPVPTHRDIQSLLVEAKDKSPSFIGSSQWIGSTEVGIILDRCYGVTMKTLFVSSGAEVDSHARTFAAHFDSQGTPCMIGGGVLAYGLLGVDLNTATGEVRYLVLDPHLETSGPDNLTYILKHGWCGWKKSKDIFLAEHFYNFGMPQRPADSV